MVAAAADLGGVADAADLNGVAAAADLGVVAAAADLSGVAAAADLIVVAAAADLGGVAAAADLGVVAAAADLGAVAAAADLNGVAAAADLIGVAAAADLIVVAAANGRIWRFSNRFFLEIIDASFDKSGQAELYANVNLFRGEFPAITRYGLFQRFNCCKVADFSAIIYKRVKIKHIKRINAIMHHTFFTNLAALFFIVCVFLILFPFADHAGFKGFVAVQIIHCFPPYKHKRFVRQTPARPDGRQRTHRCGSP